MVNYPCAFLNAIIPGSWSANTITVMGQLPIILFAFYVIITEGAQIDPEHLLSKSSCFYTAVFLYWFSIMDIVDGIRARTTKTGTPVGRIIDEGGDVIV